MVPVKNEETIVTSFYGFVNQYFLLMFSETTFFYGPVDLLFLLGSFLIW